MFLKDLNIKMTDSRHEQNPINVLYLNPINRKHVIKKSILFIEL